jgi:hypothetical protein
MLESNEEKKYILITDKSKDLVLKVKFFKLPETEEEGEKLRVRIVKKKGDLVDSYELIKNISIYLEEFMEADEVKE